MLMYCDPPAVQNPTILADKDKLTTKERRSNEKNAIFAVGDKTAVSNTAQKEIPMVTNYRIGYIQFNRQLKDCVTRTQTMYTYGNTE